MSDKRKKFKYSNVENVDSIFNYIATINKGIKNRQLSFGTDDDMIDLDLPDDAEFEIRAESRGKRGVLELRLEWRAESSTKSDDGKSGATVELTRESDDSHKSSGKTKKKK